MTQLYIVTEWWGLLLDVSYWESPYRLTSSQNRKLMAERQCEQAIQPQDWPLVTHSPTPARLNLPNSTTSCGPNVHTCEIMRDIPHSNHSILQESNQKAHFPAQLLPNLLREDFPPFYVIWGVKKKLPVSKRKIDPMEK